MSAQVEFTLVPEDVASARLLALGIRPPFELSLFVVAVLGLMAWSVSPWRSVLTPLLIGLTACLGAFRVIQIGQVKAASIAAFNRNATLRRPISVSWDGSALLITPAGSRSERIGWNELKPLRENARVVLLTRGKDSLHAIPKRAFANSAQLAALRRAARRP